MHRAIDQVERFAKLDDVVLFEGESGVGKSLLAEHVHTCSRRSTRPLHTVDLGAIDDALAGSVLFGHERGSFTGAVNSRLGAFSAANHGTLFLDEIGKASRTIQQKLLRAIERGEIAKLGDDRVTRVDVRIVAATNLSLTEATQRGEFLPDLFARIMTFRVRIPPLRERTEDIPLLVEEMLLRASRRYGYDEPPTVDPEVLRDFKGLPWPHNVRQLDGAIRRLVVEADGACVISMQVWRAVRRELDIANVVVVHSDFPTPEKIRAIVGGMSVPSLRGLAVRLGVPKTTLRRRLPDDVRQMLAELTIVNRSAEDHGPCPLDLDRGELAETS
jgi:DNA-binding NtrC family response regulator